MAILSVLTQMISVQPREFLVSQVCNFCGFGRASGIENIDTASGKNLA